MKFIVWLQALIGIRVLEQGVYILMASDTFLTAEHWTDKAI